MSKGFQFYEGTTTDSADVPRITVRSGGILVLSGAAVEMLGEGVSHVQIGFNPSTGAIGLRGTTEAGSGRYQLRQQRNGISRLVNGKRLFAHHDLPAEKARSFEAQDFGDGVVGFILPEAVKAEAPKGKATKK